MKGLLLAGGNSSRLYPVTQVMSKQLLPVYDKPMIYYPLAVQMLAGIKDIAIITRPTEKPLFQSLLGDGSRFGIQITYLTQDQPRGIAEALVIAESFQGQDSICLMLGDNLLYGEGLPKFLRQVAQENVGATIFGYKVSDPSAYGVVRFSKTGQALALIEKPKTYISPYAIPGLYFYDNQAAAMAKQLQPSARGELEITDLNQAYLEKGQLQVKVLGRGITWLDTGTAESLFQASQFVHVIEQQQGLKIACLEEIAYRMGYISAEVVLKQAHALKNGYGRYLEQIVQDEAAF